MEMVHTVPLAAKIRYITNFLALGGDQHPLKKEFPFVSGPVRIKEGIFIGAGSIVLSGVTVGPFSCVMSGSVVSRNVPPHTLMGGNPIRVIRKLD